MKNFTTLLLIFICLSFNIIAPTPAFAVGNIFKEGIYKLSDLNISTDNIYTAGNVSSNKGIYLLVYDDNQVVLQTLRLPPSSKKYELVPLKPNYRLVIIGDGDAYIDKKPL